MAEDGEADQNAVIRGILESMVSGELPPRGVSADSVAQLLAAALAQAGQSILSTQGSSQTQEDVNQDQHNSMEASKTGSEGNFDINPLATDEEKSTQNQECHQLDDSEVVSTVEVPTSDMPRLLCIKFPIELRRKIVAQRKEGRQCRDIAKELKVSVSGVRKVWERFLATGMIHDRKPSTYAGRPRKYPISPSFEIQYTSENIVDTESPHIEYVTISQSDNGETIPISTAGTTLTDDGTVFVEGPLDMPGATVEIVETDPQPVHTLKGRGRPKKEAPVYREQLLLRLIEDCPLAVFRDDVSKSSSPHVLNLDSISKRSLYMEYVLGHPFGKVPPQKPFEGDTTEAKVILSDPVNPLGKDILASLGYSTKVYFNLCCKPSPLFDQDKVISNLPFSLGPGHISETTQSVLQLLVNLCQDPVTGLSQIPRGNRPSIIATTGDGLVTSVEFSVPDKLSSYWSMMYRCASLFGCCENFLSASPPSAPCLLCHPFEKVAMQLEIKEPPEEALSPLSTTLPLQSNQSSTQGDALMTTEQSILSPTGSVTTLDIHDRTEPDLERSVGTSKQGSGKGRGRKRGRPRRETELSPQDQLVIDEQCEVHTSTSSIEAMHSVEAYTPTSIIPTSTNSLSEVDVHHIAVSPQILSITNTTSDIDNTCSNLHTPLIIHRNRTSKVSPTTLGETSLTNTKQDSTHETDTSIGLHELLTSNQAMSSTGQSTTECVIESTNLQNVRRSPRKRTPKTFTPTDSKVSPTTKRKTRKQKLTDLTDVTITSSLVVGRRGRRLKGLSSHNLSSDGGEHPSNWGVEDVSEFIAGIPRCNYSMIFKEHEVDGESLLSLDPEMMVKLMGLKTGPALRIHRKIDDLKRQFGVTTQTAND